MKDIGKFIREVLDERGMSVTTFARLMSCSRQNAHRILKKKTLDTELLMRISEILEHDFFRDISENRYSGTMNDKK